MVKCRNGVGPSLLAQECYRTGASMVANCAFEGARGCVQGSWKSWAPYGVGAEAWGAVRVFVGTARRAEIRWAGRAVAEGRTADYKAREG